MVDHSYTKDRAHEIAAEVFALMADGFLPRTACKAVGVSFQLLEAWCIEYPELGKGYAIARVLMADVIAEETIEIADEEVGTTSQGGSDSGAVSRNALRIKTRQWMLSKIAARKYGDKLELSGGLVNATAEIDPAKYREIRQQMLEEDEC